MIQVSELFLYWHSGLFKIIIMVNIIIYIIIIIIIIFFTILIIYLRGIFKSGNLLKILEDLLTDRLGPYAWGNLYVPTISFIIPLARWITFPIGTNLFASQTRNANRTCVSHALLIVSTSMCMHEIAPEQHVAICATDTGPYQLLRR